MDSQNQRRYVPAPPPTARNESQKRLQLRLELAKPSVFTKDSENSIVDLLRKTRSPFAAAASAESKAEEVKVEAEAQALEDALRSFQKELIQQERNQRQQQIQLDETEAALSRRAAELADERRLLDKQREVFEAGLRDAAQGGRATPVSDESVRAIKELQAKLDEQARAIEESKEWLHEREAFLEESEKTLFEKMQAQQERETEMEQKAENLKGLEKKLTALAEKLRAAGESV